MEGTNLQPALGVDDRAQMGKRALFWKNLAKSGVAPLCQTFAVRDFAHFPIEPLGGRAVDAKDTMRGAAGGGCDAAVAREGPGRAPPGWAPGRRGRQRQQHECGGRQQQHSTAFTPVGRRHPQNDGTSRGGSMTLHFCCGRVVFGMCWGWMHLLTSTKHNSCVSSAFRSKLLSSDCCCCLCPSVWYQHKMPTCNERQFRHNM